MKYSGKTPITDVDGYAAMVAQPGHVKLGGNLTTAQRMAWAQAVARWREEVSAQTSENVRSGWRARKLAKGGAA